jgi:hypothetical protein
MSNEFHVYNDWHPPREPEDNIPRMVRWVMQKLHIEDTATATTILMVFSICTFLLSLYFFFVF